MQRHLLKITVYGIYLDEVVSCARMPPNRRLLWVQDGPVGRRLCAIRGDFVISTIPGQRRSRPGAQNPQYPWQS